MTSSMLAVEYDAPLVNPSPNGLFAVTTFVQDGDGPSRFIMSGVQIRVFNYGGAHAFSVWAPSWNVAEADLTGNDVKRGERPSFPDPFEAETTWAADECDMTAASQDEVRTRAKQTHRLLEPVQAEKFFAARLLADVDTPDTAADIVGAVARIEGLFARTNTLGLIHASAEWAASAAQANLLRYNGGKLTTPLGHTWVFGGGYVGADGLANKLVATSPTFGWRSAPESHDGIDYQRTFAAVVERSVAIGYEALIGAVDVTG